MGANRADLVQPAQAPTGLPYGQHKELMDTQGQVPLPQQAAPTMGMDRVLAAAQGYNAPMGGLAAPSTRPFEPVTAGLASGPGPGPEVLRPRGAADLLAKVALESGSSELQALAERARMMGL